MRPGDTTERYRAVMEAYKDVWKGHVRQLRDELFRKQMEAGAGAWAEHGLGLRYGRLADQKLNKSKGNRKGSTADRETR